MLADNFLAELVPPVVFAVAVSVNADLSAQQTLWYLVQVTALFMLYGYTFDASNQSRHADEDRVNKPHRPVPAGLITAAGARRRFWVVMPFYTLLGWQLGVLEWVLLWQATTIFLNLLVSPRFYVWSKTPCMALGLVAQLAAVWQVAGPIDGTAVLWLATLAALYVPPMPFEDIRDMAGDRAIGRRTPALMLGHWPIRIWFAAFMYALPLVSHFALFAPTGAPASRIAVCDIVVAAVCWTAGARALLLRNATADRTTYQLFTMSYVLTLATGALLWS